MNETLRRLEEKIAYLEHHVTEQDKVMLEMGDEIARLKLQVKLLSTRARGAGETAEGPDAADERPPHY